MRTAAVVFLMAIVAGALSIQFQTQKTVARALADWLELSERSRKVVAIVWMTVLFAVIVSVLVVFVLDLRR